MTNVASLQTDLSDHNMLDISISTNPTSTTRPLVNKFDDNEFRSLDFTKADLEALNMKLSEVDWNELRSLCSAQEFPSLFTNTLFQICKSVVPVKKGPKGKPKALNALRRKKKRLKIRLDAVRKLGSSVPLIRELEDKIALICYEIKEAINQRLDQNECIAVSKIKSNPKFFFSYAKSFSQAKSGRY